MQIEIIGGDPSANKAVQAMLASRGFKATVSKPEHTPGPWQHTAFEITSADGMTTIIERRHISGKSNNEAVSNALLIAAAPETAAERDRLAASNAELLAALSGMVAEVDSGARVRGPAVESARAAIANAERSAK